VALGPGCVLGELVVALGPGCALGEGRLAVVWESDVFSDGTGFSSSSGVCTGAESGDTDPATSTYAGENGPAAKDFCKQVPPHVGYPHRLQKSCARRVSRENAHRQWVTTKVSSFGKLDTYVAVSSHWHVITCASVVGQRP